MRNKNSKKITKAKTNRTGTATSQTKTKTRKSTSRKGAKQNAEELVKPIDDAQNKVNTKITETTQDIYCLLTMEELEFAIDHRKIPIETSLFTDDKDNMHLVFVTNPNISSFI